MKSVTLSIAQTATAIMICLQEGAPWENGAALATKELPPNPWHNSELTEKEVRNGILEGASALVLRKTADCLGELLLGGETGKAWAAYGGDLRTYLSVDPKLDWVPWETALIPSSRQPAFINVTVPFVRYRPPQREIRRAAMDRIVMVIVVSVDPKNTVIGAQKELRMIREALHPASRVLELVELRNPTRSQIFNVLRDRKPAVLHFIGHGEAAELKLWNGASYERWSVTDIGQDLDNAQWNPHLVFLNACRSLDGSADQNSSDRLWSVAGTFQEKGACAVVAMQGPVSGEVAGLLAREFYSSIAKGVSADVALASGRNQLSLHSTFGKGRDPYLPALVMGSSPDDLLAHSCCGDSDNWVDHRRYETLVSSCDLLVPAVGEFVDREPGRWYLLDQFIQTEHQPVSVIVGRSGIGKTWLLAWCTDAWLRRRRHVRYIRMSACVDWLSFIRRVSDGAPSPGVVFEPLSAMSRNYLKWRLNHLARGGTTMPEGPMPGNVPDELPKLARKLKKKKAPEFHIHAFAALADALEQNPDNVPIILVLDDFGDGKEFFPTEDFGYLVENFLKAHLLARETKIRVIISLSESQEQHYQTVLPSSFRRTQLPLFSEGLADHIRLLYKLRFKRDIPAKSDERLSEEFQTKQLAGEELSALCQNIHKYESIFIPGARVPQTVT